jgi:hypothetical protein
MDTLLRMQAGHDSKRRHTAEPGVQSSTLVARLCRAAAMLEMARNPYEAPLL